MIQHLEKFNSVTCTNTTEILYLQALAAWVSCGLLYHSSLIVHDIKWQVIFFVIGRHLLHDWVPRNSIEICFPPINTEKKSNKEFLKLVRNAHYFYILWVLPCLGNMQNVWPRELDVEGHDHNSTLVTLEAGSWASGEPIPFACSYMIYHSVLQCI